MSSDIGSLHLKIIIKELKSFTGCVTHTINIKILITTHACLQDTLSDQASNATRA